MTCMHFSCNYLELRTALCHPSLLCIWFYNLNGVGTEVHERFFILGFGRQDYEDISHPIPQNSDFAGV